MVMQPRRQAFYVSTRIRIHRVLMRVGAAAAINQ